MARAWGRFHPAPSISSWRVFKSSPRRAITDRKSTRLNSSHSQISYAVFCLKKKTPRLILTVVTIGLAQIFGAIELIMPYLINRHAKLKVGFATPLSFHFTYGHFRFSGDHVVVMIVTPIVIGGLVWFLRGTGYGLSAPAAADDTDRARLLGVKVKRVSLLVWAIAGFLSALT